MHLKLSKYGKHLGNRLECREILSSLKNELIFSNMVIIDFSDVSLITMSFGTELFDTIYSIKNREEIKIINTSKLVEGVVAFCLKNKKEKVIA